MRAYTYAQKQVLLTFHCSRSDMGLGKTVQTLGLILSNPPKNRTYGKARKPLAPVIDTDEPECTLIVCPVSVMSNWIEQIESHVKDGCIRAEIYAGEYPASLSASH